VDGKNFTSARQIQAGDPIVVRFSDGFAEAVTERTGFFEEGEG
jgi:hypothetical protein